MRYLFCFLLCLLIGCQQQPKQPQQPQPHATATATPAQTEELDLIKDFSRFAKLDEKEKGQLFDKFEANASRLSANPRIQEKLMDIAMDTALQEPWRERACVALTKMENRKEFSAQFLEILRDPEAGEGLKNSVVESVAGVSQGNEELLTFLLDLLNDPKQAGLHANLVLGMNGVHDPRVRNALTSIYSDRSRAAELRANAASSLVTFAGQPEAEGVLRAALLDREVAIRKAMVTEFTKQAKKTSLPYLEMLAKDNHPDVSQPAQRGLAEVRSALENPTPEPAGTP